MNSDEKIYRIFIGHAWNYKDEYYKLERMLDKVTGFKWQNIFPGFVSPEQDSTNELIDALRRQIEPSELVMILSDLYESNKKWIKEEIEMAQKMEKPIIVIGPSEHARIPEELLKVATYVVEWDGPSLVDTIKHSVSEHDVEAKRAKSPA